MRKVRFRRHRWGGQTWDLNPGSLMVELMLLPAMVR